MTPGLHLLHLPFAAALAMLQSAGCTEIYLHLSHFSAAVIFSFFVSIVFGITQRSNEREMVRHGAYCFGVFVVGMFVVGWVMWLLHH
jgi:hypothetical protein